ncbi:MAG: hypothetical protein OEY85_09905 [Rhodospirillales bacterium]|nr:hypothetical protein [Rhodospirillales bacterium]
MKKLFAAAFAAALIAGMGTSAFAASCPKDMKAIDAALAGNPALSATQMSQVKELRAKGEAEHQAKNHKASVEALHKAMEMLGISK